MFVSYINFSVFALFSGTDPNN